jgi:hypothetical protein
MVDKINGYKVNVESRMEELKNTIMVSERENENLKEDIQTWEKQAYEDRS